MEGKHDGEFDGLVRLPALCLQPRFHMLDKLFERFSPALMEAHRFALLAAFLTGMQCCGDIASAFPSS